MVRYELNERYAGWLEGVSPYSTTMKQIRIGDSGDEIEVHSRWVDQNSGVVWLYVEVQGELGWVLEYETDEIVELL